MQMASGPEATSEDVIAMHTLLRPFLGNDKLFFQRIPICNREFMKILHNVSKNAMAAFRARCRSPYQALRYGAFFFYGWQTWWSYVPEVLRQAGHTITDFTADDRAFCRVGLACQGSFLELRNYMANSRRFFCQRIGLLMTPIGVRVDAEEAEEAEDSIGSPNLDYDDDGEFDTEPGNNEVSD